MFALSYNPIQAGNLDGATDRIHDKGLLRALNTKYKKPNIKAGITRNPFKTLFVARLNPVTGEETLSRLFQQYGIIEKLQLVRCKKTGISRRYAFIEFENERACEKAYHRANRLLIDGYQILVDYERSRTMKGWKPRRLGGGLGGRKQSGQLRFGGRDRPFKNS